MSRLHQVPIECVRRGFEACFTLNINPDEYINRYITKTDKTKNIELIEVYKDLLKDRFNKQQLIN